jgi:MFS family permease
MRRLADALYDVALTLWVGGLWTIGYLVAPTLFAALSADRQKAGLLAGQLFELIGWVGLACGTYLLLFVVVRMGAAALRRWNFWLLLVMLLLTAISLFGLQPLLAQLKADALPREVMESVLRNRFAAWHGVSSILYLVQSVLGLLLVTRFGRGAK